jgi:hypothetical protein
LPSSQCCRHSHFRLFVHTYSVVSKIFCFVIANVLNLSEYFFLDNDVTTMVTWGPHGYHTATFKWPRNPSTFILPLKLNWHIIILILFTSRKHRCRLWMSNMTFISKILFYQFNPIHTFKRPMFNLWLILTNIRIIQLSVAFQCIEQLWTWPSTNRFFLYALACSIFLLLNLYSVTMWRKPFWVHLCSLVILRY